MSSVPIAPVAVAGVGESLTTHEPPDRDRSAHPGELTTSPRPPTPAPNHVNDQPTTTINHVHDQLTTTATTTDNTTTNHDQNQSRHWHPWVPATRATLPSTGEGAGAAPC